MTITVSDAIQQVALNMSLIKGSGMSPYSDDQIAQYLRQAHNKIIEDWTWPEMVVSVQRTLDGTTGKATVALAPSDGIDNYRQIKFVYIDSVRRALPQVSGYLNPLLQWSLVGYTILNNRDDPSRQYIVKIVPPTQGGQMLIVANTKADFTNPDTVVPIDDDLHTYLATWMWAVDDATNPGQVEKYLNLYDDRIKSIRANVNIGPYAMNPFNGPIEQWFEYNSPDA